MVSASTFSLCIAGSAPPLEAFNASLLRSSAHSLWPVQDATAAFNATCFQVRGASGMPDWLWQESLAAARTVVSNDGLSSAAVVKLGIHARFAADGADDNERCASAPASASVVGEVPSVVVLALGLLACVLLLSICGFRLWKRKCMNVSSTGSPADANCSAMAVARAVASELRCRDSGDFRDALVKVFGISAIATMTPREQRRLKQRELCCDLMMGR